MDKTALEPTTHTSAPLRVAACLAIAGATIALTHTLSPIGDRFDGAVLIGVILTGISITLTLKELTRHDGN